MAALVRDVAHRNIPNREISEWPVFNIMNQLRVTRYDEDTIFIHRAVEYTGWLECTAEAAQTSRLVRICIVQPKRGGQEMGDDKPTSLEVFKTENPTIATPINEEDFVRISDRHYLVTPGERLRLDYLHRLTNNLSHQKSSLGDYNVVYMCPMFLCKSATTTNS